MSRERLVIVGNGMAGVRMLEELLAAAPERYDVTVFGAEPHPAYNRILLSPVLAGEVHATDIVLRDIGWYRAQGVHLHVGRRVTRIDRARRAVIAEDGVEAPYDRLVLATGARAVVPTLAGAELPGVHPYRDLRDTGAIISAAARYRRAVVIGGGLLGLEAANGLNARGMDVTVVHLRPWLMERQLDVTAARLLQQALAARGIGFRLPAQTLRLQAGAQGRVAAVELADGTSLAADLVVMAVGIQPNIELARAAGLHCRSGGIVVSDTMQSYDPRIYAIGECVAHRGVRYGLVEPLYEMARVCASHLAGHGIGRFTGAIPSTRLKVTGIDLFSAGEFAGTPDTESIVLHDPDGGVYRKVVLRGNRLVGALFYGDTAGAGQLLEQMRAGRDLGSERDALLWAMPAPQASDAGAAAMSGAASHRQVA